VLAHLSGYGIRSVLVVLPALLAGCGGDEIRRVEVSGSVTLDGKPLDDAAILFVPIEGGPTAGTEFTGGQYRIEQSGGPSPGPYRVEITAFRNTGEMIPDSDLPEKMEERQESIVPARYNRESELRAELTAEGDNRQDFALESE
jgi:hypothetical protein